MLSPTKDMVRFGPFELDLNAWQLRKSGIRIKIPQQPLQLLAMLLERPGVAFTRDELRQRLWPSDIFVDFDHGLNKNVQKLREALGDSADCPRYIETIPRIGYRFIGPPTDLPQSKAKQGDAKTPETAVTVLSGQANRKRTWGRKLLWAVFLGCAAAMVSLAVWLVQRRSQVAPIRSVAVLPLKNLSGDRNQDYFADGMTDELITMLAKNSTLRVISQTSAMQYKGVHRPVRDIAHDLGVDGIVEGSVERSGNKVHMTIQLIHAASDTNMWAESYDRDSENSVSLPREAARAIAGQLKKVATPAEPARFINPEAHDAYLRGRYYWFFAGGPTGFPDPPLQKAGEYLKKATELQPDYALAWSGLSGFYLTSVMHGASRPADDLPRAESAAVRALQLDESLADAHDAMAANYLFYRWDWQRALMESTRSIELDPNSVVYHYFQSRIFVTLNRMDEALEEQKKATELDPFAMPYAMGYMLLIMGRYDAALNEVRLRLETLPQEPRLHRLLAEAYWYKGMKKDAGQELEKATLLESAKSGEAAIRQAFERGGYEGIIRLQVEDLNRKAAREYVAPMLFADRYAQLSLKEETIHFLNEAYKEHSPRLVWLQSFPAYNFLHSDERYRAIVRQVGLPPAF